tara:strand:+ start:8125 stop:8349 length:225 start_codon:yes stop_codon:yes gene_type:complete
VFISAGWLLLENISVNENFKEKRMIEFLNSFILICFWMLAAGLGMFFAALALYVFRDSISEFASRIYDWYEAKS